MEELEGNALLALLGLARAPGSGPQELSRASSIEQFDVENAQAGLSELGERGFATTQSGRWYLTDAGQAEADARYEPDSYI
jgi:hypothetical protein